MARVTSIRASVSWRSSACFYAVQIVLRGRVLRPYPGLSKASTRYFRAAKSTSPLEVKSSIMLPLRATGRARRPCPFHVVKRHSIDVDETAGRGIVPLRPPGQRSVDQRSGG